MDAFKPVDNPPSDLRDAYLDGLSEHQEFFLEQRIARAQTWCLADRAHVIVDGPQIVEFFVGPADRPDADAIFEAARQATGAQTALCKSFDTQLLGPALARPAQVTATGILFRSYTDRPLESRPELAFRTAQPADIAAVAACDDDGFFEGNEEIEGFVNNGTLDILERDGTLIGCGTRIRVNPGRPAVDLGMLVDRRQRGKGFGSHIIALMKADVLQQGLVPICGCAARNTASRRALTKAGFQGEHRLLRIALASD